VIAAPHCLDVETVPADSAARLELS
jgi:hypothetical protein